MKRQKQTTRQMLESMHELCGQINEDDGVDPRIYFRKTRRAKVDHKTWQLCHQVAKVLHFCLNDCDDPIVQSVRLIRVVPNPDSTGLLLIIEFDQQSFDPNQALQALQQQATRLQFEIARSIHRKRVPNLAFSISPTAETNIASN